MGRFFGRHVEEAIGSMMERNDRILELGFECECADSNIVITRTLLRNNDFARGRRRKTEGFEQEDEDLQALALGTSHAADHFCGAGLHVFWRKLPIAVWKATNRPWIRYTLVYEEALTHAQRSQIKIANIVAICGQICRVLGGASWGV